MKRNLAKVLVLIFIVSTFFVGCNNDKKTDTNTVSKSDQGKTEKVEIDLFNFKLEIASELDKAAELYMASNKNVTIRTESIAEGYGTQLKSRVQAGRAPVIFNVGGPSDVKEWLPRLEDLSDQPWVKEAVEGILGGVTVDEKVYGLPYSIEGYGFVYNTEIFEAAGIDAKSIKDYATLECAVKKLDEKIKAGELKEQFPDLEAVFELPAKETWLTGQHSTNVALSQEFDSSIAAFNAPTVEFKYSDALKKIIDIQADYSSNADNKGKLNAVDYTMQVEQGLAIERVAMVQQGNWVYPAIKEMDQEIADKLDMLPIPLDGVVDDHILVGVPMFWAVNKEASDAQKDAAKDFMNWLYNSEEGKDIIVNKFLFIPPFKNYEGYETKDQLSCTIQQYANEDKTSPWVFMGYPSGWSMEIMGAEIQKYLDGKNTWEETLDNAKAKWKELRSAQ